MKTKRILRSAAVAMAVLAVGVWLFGVASSRPSGDVDAHRLVGALHAYAEAIRSQGQAMPFEVSLAELLRTGLLTEADAGDLAGMDVTFGLSVDESRPGEVLARVRLADGEEVFALSDGSVQTRR